MKKLVVLPGLFAFLTIMSCNHRDKNIDITYSENEQYYSMIANFGKSKTRDVEKYMDYKIGHRSNMSFVNSTIDGTIALDDHTTFYLKKEPGHIKLKFDKTENSGEAYDRVKAMCQGIKKVVINQ